MTRTLTLLPAVVLIGAAAAVLLADRPATRPGAPDAPSAAKEAAASAGAAGNLDYWLSQARPADSQPATMPGQDVGDGEKEGSSFREDALPGVVELSDGRVLAGWLYTTRERPWLVYPEGQRQWRMVPFITALSITAVVVEEKIEQRWRWKEMGVPERVYTGEEYPTRRLKWRFHLIDGSAITGEVKGQPLWVEHQSAKHGPFVLHERSKGEIGQTLEDLVYVKRVIVSRRMMEAVLKEQQGQKKD